MPRQAVKGLRYGLAGPIARPAPVRRASRRGTMKEGYRADHGHVTASGGDDLQMSDV